MAFHRIKNLEKRGIIEYYYTTIDPSKLGYKAYRVYIKTQNLSLEKEKEMMNWLVKNKKTWWVLTVDGKYNIDILWWAKDDYEFEEEWLKFLQKFRKYVDEKLIQIYTHLYHFHRLYLVDKNKDDEKEEIIFSKETEKVDKIDFKLLKELSVKGRKSLVNLSEKIKLSPKNISYRIKSLKEKKIITSFRIKNRFE